MAINRWVEAGRVYIEIHCGCCAHNFSVELGGSAFCQICLNGNHANCVIEITKGIKE